MKKNQKNDKKATKNKKVRRSFGQQRTEWFTGISNRLSIKCQKNVKKIENEIKKVKDDKAAVKKLNEIKSAMIQAEKILKA